jgi:uncharacterized protein
MIAASQNRPLTDAEIEALEERLAAIDPDDSMAVEEFDGFCAALACCPEPIPRDEWLPMVFGETARARAALRGEGDDATLLGLVDRHRVAVAAMLQEGEGFAPVLSYDEDGRAWGNAWAIGFARGMSLRPDAWAPLEQDDEHADALDPVMRLVADAQQDDEDDGEVVEILGDAGDVRHDPDDPDPAGRGHDDEDDDDDGALEAYEPIADDEREAVIRAMLDGMQDVFDFFREARGRAYAPATMRRADPKVGPNDPCPCGSGRKSKHCCGASTVH